MRSRQVRSRIRKQTKIGVVIAALFMSILLLKSASESEWLQGQSKRWFHKGCISVITYLNVNQSPIRAYVLGESADIWQSFYEQVFSHLPLQQYIEGNEEKSDFWQKESFWMTASEGITALNYEQETDSKPASDSKVSDASAKVKPTEGILLEKKQLADFNYMISNYFAVSGTTYITENDVNMLTLSQMDMTLKQTDASKPQILIYHTHSQEDFTDTIPGDASTTIVAVGDYLTQLLEEKYGYNVIHDTTSYDLVDGVLDRNKAYDYARENISRILEENPTVEVVLDVHRDGVKEGTHLVTEINGKQTAKIMFFNGMSRIQGIGDVDALYNPYRTENLAMSLQMRLAALENYPDFVRTNYLNAYKYNLDMRPKAMLIEVGAQTNSLQEELNAMEPLAELLNQVLTS